VSQVDAHMNFHIKMGFEEVDELLMSPKEARLIL
jgi:hypothetical protein